MAIRSGAESEKINPQGGHAPGNRSIPTTIRYMWWEDCRSFHFTQVMCEYLGGTLDYSGAFRDSEQGVEKRQVEWQVVPPLKDGV